MIHLFLQTEIEIQSSGEMKRFQEMVEKQLNFYIRSKQTKDKNKNQQEYKQYGSTCL